MFYIDIISILSKLDTNNGENLATGILGPEPIDYVSSILIDSGYRPNKGRYVFIPHEIKDELYFSIIKQIMGVSCDASIELSTVNNYVGINIR